MTAPRRSLFVSVFVAVAIIVAITDRHVFALQEKVVYGEDDRLDEYEVPIGSMKTTGASTVVLVKKADLDEIGNGNYQVSAPPTLADMGICDTEKFASQPIPGFCSGFLASPNQIVTAGHCIETTADCDEVAFVFGFVQSGADTTTLEFSPDQVYFCSSFKSVLVYPIDFAVVTLDRSVVGFFPIPISSRKAKLDDSIYVVGHPSGLPRKYANDAKVKGDADSSSIYEYHFLADLDTFGGNSGSGVFFMDTHEAAGILVRGAEDYLEDTGRGCYVVNVCDSVGSSDICGGEDVTYSQIVNPFLPNACQGSDDCSGNGQCVSNVCQCNSGFYGTDCSFVADRSICSDNGEAVGLWECQCDNGYYGTLCENFSSASLQSPSRSGRRTRTAGRSRSRSKSRPYTRSKTPSESPVHSATNLQHSSEDEEDQQTVAIAAGVAGGAVAVAAAAAFGYRRFKVNQQSQSTEYQLRPTGTSLDI
eukprot:TRINITY_DN7367_c0_g1_i12.p1 TRINITY_DN7367_c0_g1~~TRINITY_DN7367_c0_g1_i12.p1  ORF type:complete len:476 (+),score=99.98 TRINITY_DN7367_c0_g1_i12:51-1478(+)